MHWLGTMDTALFRLINLSLSNPVLDLLMPLFASNTLLILGCCGILLMVWKGGMRGIICAVLLLLALAVTDSICNTVKYAVARPRPFLAVVGTNVLIGKG